MQTIEKNIAEFSNENINNTPKMSRLTKYISAHELFPLLPKIQETEVALKDNTENEDAEDSVEDLDIQAWISALEVQYGAVAATEIVTSHGSHNHLVKVDHKYPLHYAAAEGNLHMLAALLNQGYSINAKDNLNSTPLHVAVMMNQFATVQFLVEKGANINAFSYEEWDSVSLAIVKGHYQIAEYLLKQPNIYVDDITLYTVMDALFTMSEKGTKQELNNILRVIELLAEHTSPAVLNVPGDGFEVEALPISVLLRIVASSTEDAQARAEINKTADAINQYDTTESIYIDAKLLMHVLPISGYYQIAYDKNGSFDQKYSSSIGAEGHFANYTVDAAAQTVSTYIKQIDSSKSAQHAVFEKIQATISYSAQLADATNDQQVISNLYQNYKNGNTILLPTGWEGHFVVTILDSKNGYFAVSNTGMSYDGNESGSIVYKMHHPENVTPEILQTILNNEEQFKLEYDLHYQLGLEKLYVLPEPPQTTGNCGWRSIEVAVEALAFMALAEKGYTSEDAQTIAHDWYLDWYQYTCTDVLKSYLENDPRLDIDALSDILVYNHPSLFDSSVPMNPHEWERAQLVIDAMSSEQYKDKFDQVAYDYNDARPELKSLIESHGFDLSSIDSLVENFDNLNFYTWPMPKHDVNASKIEIKDVLTLNSEDHPLEQLFVETQDVTLSSELNNGAVIYEQTFSHQTWQDDSLSSSIVTFEI